jgi:ABC-type sulfate/molybdate transport systems ATPase subunit
MATHDHDFAVTAGSRIVALAEGRIAKITADDGIIGPVP